jgi:hypothetical protein
VPKQRGKQPVDYLDIAGLECDAPEFRQF